MNTNHRNSTHRPNGRKNERGNALIYVLIAIALFAALSFTLSRGANTGEAGVLSDDRAELYTSEIIGYATQAKSVVDQMLFSGGVSVWNIDFERPGDANFNTAPPELFLKLHHPDGGGLTLAPLPERAIAQNSTDPVAGWYVGRFNNVEWTKNTGHDIMLVAHQIEKIICEKINIKATGSTAIPAISATVTLAELFIDDAFHTGTNEEFDTTDCAACENYQALCVSNNAATRFSYYAVMADNPRD